MKNSKLIEALVTFRAKDFREFGEFIRSPYFNKNEEITRFFDHLRDLSPKFPEEKVDRFAIWKKLYPKKAYDDKEMGYLMSFLLKFIEQYLGLARYAQDPHLPRLHSLEALQNRGLDKHFSQGMRRLSEALDQIPVRNAPHFFYRFQLASLAVREFHRKRLRTFDSSLQEAANHLDDYFLIEKLRLSCELANRKNIISAEYDLRLVDEVLSYLDNLRGALKPAIAIYHQLLRLLSQADKEASFAELKSLLARHSAELSPDELREIYSYAENFCITMVKRGHEAYLRELFGIYRGSLASEAIFEEGSLSPWKFKNMVSVALRLGEYDWTQSFIRDYLDRLPPEFQETAKAYNQANYFYHIRKFDQALRSLMQVEFTDVFYSLDTRKMMLRIYYEQGETEPFHSLVAAFRVYLKRNKLISEANREAYKNFVDLTNALMKAETPKAVEKVLADIQGRNPLTDREWLIEQAQLKKEDA